MRENIRELTEVCKLQNQLIMSHDECIGFLKNCIDSLLMRIDFLEKEVTTMQQEENDHG